MMKTTKNVLLSVGALAFSLAAFVMLPSENVCAKEHAPKGMYVENTDVSGMTEQEIESVITTNLDTKQKKKITLKAGDNTLEVSGKDLGVSVSKNLSKRIVKYTKTGNPLEKAVRLKAASSGKKKTFNLALSVDSGILSNFINMNSDKLSNEAVNNGLKRENGKFVFVKGKDGEEIDKDDATVKIRDFIEKEWDSDKSSIEIATHKVHPKGDEAELSKVKDLLGSYSTDYSTSAAGRKANVALGASRVNGTVLYKGDIIDVYKKVGPLTAANGYQNAGVYKDGKVVDAEGGGICQVSTTLYNAVIRAELGIELRACHQMIVHYCDPSFDAAIAEGAGGVPLKNLKIKNTLDAPIYIEAITNGSTITMNVYGQETRPANRKVSYENEIQSAEEIGHNYTADPSLPVGTIRKTASGSIGYKARLWKIVTVDGVEQSRKVYNNSNYRMLAEEDAVGVASSDPARTQRMIEAINSKNQATVESTAQALAAEEGGEFKLPFTEKSILAKQAEGQPAP